MLQSRSLRGPRSTTGWGPFRVRGTGTPGSRPGRSIRSTPSARGWRWLVTAMFPAPVPNRALADGETRASRERSPACWIGCSHGGTQHRVVVLRFEAFDPRLAAEVVNTMAQLHVERDMEFRLRPRGTPRSGSNNGFPSSGGNLNRASGRSRAYREEHGATAVEIGRRSSSASWRTCTRPSPRRRWRGRRAKHGTGICRPRKTTRRPWGAFPEILRNEIIQDQRLALANLRRERAGGPRSWARATRT